MTGQHKASHGPVQKLQARLRQAGVQAAWITSEANRQYLSGFTGSSGWVIIPAQGKGWLITDGRYTEQAAKEAEGFQVKVCQKNPLDALVALFKRRRISRLVFEDEQVSVAAWKRFHAQLPDLKGQSGSGWVEKLRSIKSPSEIRYIKIAVQIAEKAYAAVQKRIRPGITEMELAHGLEAALYAAGAERLAFPLIVASGPHSAMPHASPTHRRLKAGDLLTLDFGACFKGYHSDLTRTVAVVRSSSKQREIYNCVKNAQNLAKTNIISGQMASESDKKARQIFRQAGMEKAFLHGLGHGIGLEIHEAPRLSTRSEDRLETGMVVTCEPGLYLPGWGGVRIEDDLVVGSGESQWLSRSPEALLQVGKSGI